MSKSISPGVLWGTFYKGSCRWVESGHLVEMLLQQMVHFISDIEILFVIYSYTQWPIFLTLWPNQKFCLLFFLLKLDFLNLTIWNGNIYALISIHKTSDKIFALQLQVTRWHCYSQILKRNTKTGTSALQMCSQGCPGF